VKTGRRTKASIPALVLKGEKALQAAVAEVVEEHKRTGRPLAVWHNGKAVMMAPEKAVATAREGRASYSATKKKKAG
jgi:hypothetical protein